MQEVNWSSVTEFILLGFTPDPRTNPLLFTFFLVFYLLILVSNSLLITLIHQDSRLHTPMYFFISVLSTLDVCYTTTTVPQMLVHILSKKRAISFTRCVAQMYIFLLFGVTESWLFSIMSVDSACGSQKKSCALELELQMVLSYHMDAGNQIRVLRRAAVLLAAEPSL
ncbi:hypothetical protein STEG23_000957 [Scotinomys teguina]